MAAALVVNASGSAGVATVHALICTENAGTPAAAAVNLRDGWVSGAILATIKLAASETKLLTFPGDGLQSNGNLYIEVAAGTVRVTVVP